MTKRKEAPAKQEKGVKKKRKHIKKGILGYPTQSKNKILFIVNNVIQLFSSQVTCNKTICSWNFIFKKKKSSNQNISDTESDDESDKSFDLDSDTKSSVAFKDAPVQEEFISTTPNRSDELPYEIMLKIFKYYTVDANGDLNKLKILQNVCKYWKLVGDDPKLWHHIHFSLLFGYAKFKSNELSSKKFSQSFEKKLIKFLKLVAKENRFQYLVNLNLNNTYCLTCDQLDLILCKTKPSMITQLDLSHCKNLHLSKSHVEICFEKIIADYCPNLKSLNLTGMRVSILRFLQFFYVIL